MKQCERCESVDGGHKDETKNQRIRRAGGAAAAISACGRNEKNGGAAREI